MSTYNLQTDTLPEILSAGDIILCPYTGSKKTITLHAGQYKFECWGAQGGGKQNDSTLDTAEGGKGGYSYGEFLTTSSRTAYLYVGGMGQSSGTGIAYGGFNGGGAAWASSTGEPGNGGGGASDIRLDTDSYHYRVIVAGGGGGGGEDAGDTPGYAGGTSSSRGTATQTTGFAFGQGAQTAYDGGGGGGGWYGGTTSGGTTTLPTANSTSDTSGGDGGSSFVYIETNSENYLSQADMLINTGLLSGASSFTTYNGTTETGHSGNGFIRITVLQFFEEYATPTSLIDLNSTDWDPSLTGSGSAAYYSTLAKKTITLPLGTYKLECWGASGGDSTAHGGYGGYSSGILNLTASTNIILTVGGTTTDATGGYNGGGNGYLNGRGGGGASDIRIETDSLYSRIIVAGGGGGGGVASSYADYAGSGGGVHGYRGDFALGTTREYYIQDTNLGRSGSGGTQTSGGVTFSSLSGTCIGSFGQGGAGGSGSSGYSCGGGGGGWYGGGGAYDNDSDADGRNGGGGSGYVYTSSTVSSYPSGCLLNSSYYLSDAFTRDGVFPSPNPTSLSTTMQTRRGNGAIRITAISVALASREDVIAGSISNSENSYSTIKTTGNLFKGVKKGRTLIYGESLKPLTSGVMVINDDGEGKIKVNTLKISSNTDGSATFSVTAGITANNNKWIIE